MLLNVTKDDNPVRVFLDSQITPTGTSRHNFVIYSDVLDSSTVYRFELTVTERNRDGVGFASLTLRPNKPPSGGTCNVSPRQGTTLSTQFTFTCTGWADTDSPRLEYRFATGRQKNAQRRDRTILYSGFRSQYTADSLPLGNKENNYTIYVFVSILDRFGGETEVNMNREVVVKPLTVRGTSDTAVVEEAAVKALERVENEFGNDPQKMTETCGK
jgi:polycystin 1